MKKIAMREALESLTAADPLALILEDHKPLKELTIVLKDSDRSAKERFKAYQEFAPTLIAHAKPDEETLYKAMKSNKDLREEGLEGDVEHHIKEEEESLLPDFKKNCDACGDWQPIPRT